jgi:hypothetical protein
MPIPNPYNNYIPKVGERVRLIGACHPRGLGKVVEVTDVGEDEDGWWFASKHKDARDGQDRFSSGELGGVEPAPGCEIDSF